MASSTMDLQLDPTTLISDSDLGSVVDTLARLRTQALRILDLQGQLSAASPDTNGTISAPKSAAATEKIKKEMATLHTKMYGTNARLRAQQRGAVMSTRETKAATSEARQEVDGLSLMLQNLVYEQRHLKGEIAACEDYNHSYLSLPLISESEFLAAFPEKEELSEHDLMIARIEHEHSERAALEEERQGLLKKKQGLIAENNKRKQDLANLDKDLEKFIEAADPIVKTFDSRGE